MIEFNNIRLALGLSWNEFYLCYLIESKSEDGFCMLTRNEIGYNLGVSKQAIIDLVKKLDRSGYLLNESGKVKCTDLWSRNFTEALEFNRLEGKETLPMSNLYGKETLPPINEAVKKLDHINEPEGKETLPDETIEVKNLYQHEQEIIEQNQETAKKGKETLPENPSGNLYIDTKDNLSIKDLNKEKEKESEGKPTKAKPYFLTFNDGVATCEVLRESCLAFNKEYPGKYPTELYKNFIRYWSVPDKKGHPKWYKEYIAKRGVWHLPGRLVTWFENDQKFNKTTSNGIRTDKGRSGTLRPTSIAEPSKREGPGNVAHVEF